MGLHVYEGEDGGSYVGRRVEGGSKRRINTLTDAQSPFDDDAGRANEQPVEVPLRRNSAFYSGRGRVYRACSRHVEVGLTSPRNASPDDAILRGMAVEESQIPEADIPIEGGRCFSPGT